MGHIVGIGNCQAYVDDAGAVYGSAVSNVKLADSVEEWAASLSDVRKEVKQEAELDVEKPLLCQVCGHIAKSKAGAMAHMRIKHMTEG